MKYTTGNPAASTRATHVAPGEYKLRVLDAVERVSKKGNPMIELTLQVRHDDGTVGPKLFDYLVFDESSAWKIDQFLASAGMHPGAEKEVDVQAQEVIGWEVVAALKVETYNGNTNNKVANYIIEEF